MDDQLFLLVDDEGVRRNAVHEEDIGTDGGLRADDGFAAEDGGVGIDGHVIADVRMTFAALADASGIVLGEAARAEGDAMIEFDVTADAAGLADDHAGAVIDEKVRADARAGMDVDAGAAVRPFGHHAWQDGCASGVEHMCQALDGDGFDERIGENDFLAEKRGGVALIGGGDVGAEQFTDFGQ